MCLHCGKDGHQARTCPVKESQVDRKVATQRHLQSAKAPATRPPQSKGGGKSKGVGKGRKAGVRIVGTDEFAAYDNDADMYEEAPFNVEGGDAPPSAY